MPNNTLPDWELVLAAAARLQRILPDAVLYAGHRFSRYADHVLTDLRKRFDEVLAQLESIAGWKTARVQRPVLILGNLDGIETGVRQLVRDEPLETTQADYLGHTLTVPTEAEILRIKGVLDEDRIQPLILPLPRPDLQRKARELLPRRHVVLPRRGHHLH